MNQILICVGCIIGYFVGLILTVVVLTYVSIKFFPKEKFHEDDLFWAMVAVWPFSIPIAVVIKFITFIGSKLSGLQEKIIKKMSVETHIDHAKSDYRNVKLK